MFDRIVSYRIGGSGHPPDRRYEIYGRFRLFVWVILFYLCLGRCAIAARQRQSAAPPEGDAAEQSPWPPRPGIAVSIFSRHSESQTSHGLSQPQAPSDGRARVDGHVDE